MSNLRTLSLKGCDFIVFSLLSLLILGRKCIIFVYTPWTQDYKFNCEKSVAVRLHTLVWLCVPNNVGRLCSYMYENSDEYVAQ